MPVFPNALAVQQPQQMSYEQQLALLGMLSGNEQAGDVGRMVGAADLSRRKAAEGREAAAAESRLREQERREAAAAERQWREQQAEIARADRAEERERQRQYQAGQNAQMRAVMSGQQLTQVIDPATGQTMWVPRASAAGMQAPGGAASEDERKAAGWLSQARTAYGNMEAAVKEDPRANETTAREKLIAATPGVGPDVAYADMSPGRQKFTTAASSFSEAVLRAATGAGVNRDEALQKVQELTPRFGEAPTVSAMKKQMAEMYLQSLEARSGRAVRQAVPIPGGAALPNAVNASTPKPPPAKAPAGGVVVDFGSLKP